MTLPRMDSRIGLDYIVENREYISKLGAALDTINAVVKKQVFELLSALCAYNADGYARAIETLEYYKNLKNERYRFKIVINELEKSTNIEYQVALLAFINCVIISATNLQDRIRIRNEFIGLKVLPLLNNLRKVAQSVGDIIVQLDVFDEQRECDEAQSLQGGPNGINLNSHLDVFYAILRQVADTPQEVPFLSILQHLLRIDPKEPVSDVIWDTAEKLVHRATLLENHEDSVRLLRTPSVQKFSCPHCRGDTTSPSRKSSALPSTPSCLVSQQNGPFSPNPPPPHILIAADSTANQSTPPPPPPPPAPPLPPHAMQNHVPPPPPPPILGGFNAAPAPPPIPGAPPAPPPLVFPNNSAHSTRPVTPEPGYAEQNGIQLVLLPQQDTPAPKAKMKTLNWGKIPPNKVIGKQNIWTIVANNHADDGPTSDIDWNEMEGLFCLQSTSAQGSPKLGRGDANGSGYDTLDRKSKKENTEITLLDGKRSLNVNIFLKQFRSCNEDIIQLIRDGEHDDIGAEKLRGLLKILPEVDELDMLKTFNGDKQRLGNAEKFLLQLLAVPNYKLRIESMLLKEEFAANIGYLDPCISAMIYAGEDLLNNKMLQEVLYMVVVAGNFLNSGGYAGNAAGVKLSSLQKLTDIRANKPGMNLIHFVALQAAKRNTELLNFTAQMSTVENASKTTSEQINNEINTLDGRIRKIKKQIEQPTTDEDIQQQMSEFLESAEREVSVLQAGMKEVEAMRLKLAEFFCEDPATFRLEECFKIFQSFCEKFKQAVKENERRQQLEDQATLRRKQREEQLARRARQISQCGTPVSDPENPLLLDPTFDPRASPALARRRMGSFNSGVDISSGFIRMESNDGMQSPDITPNGSLRRRRSRVMNEEDDLMEFLRSSAGQEHNSRERKASSYGSLDRSWARRARSGSASRKRPELLNIDFGVDRERACSPAPILIERQSPLSAVTPPNAINSTSSQQQQANEDVKPRISREWRQKIESWLQSNENDEKQNEEYKRKRRLVNSNRRSLENDTESERKLDTLPEEKIAPTGTTTITTNTTTTASTATNVTNSKINSPVEGYKRVYPDWKPSKTLEHTDVVGTLQSIADVNSMREKEANLRRNIVPEQQQKAPHRLSNGYLESTSAEELREYRRQRSLESNGNGNNNSNTLHAIAEEDRRKSYMKQLIEDDASDCLQKYKLGPKDNDSDLTSQSQTAERSRPITTPTTSTQIKSSSNQSKISQPSAQISEPTNKMSGTTTTLPKHQSRNELFSSISQNTKDIDADNIETPPVSRRNITSPALVTINRKEQTTVSQNTTALGGTDADLPGYFDRHSSTRRTRRYKRPTDYSSGNEDLSPASETSPKQLHQSFSANEVRQSKDTNKEIVEQAKEKPSTKTRNVPERTVAKLEKVGRHISSINQEDVREAIRNLKSPTGTPERIWSPPRDIISIGEKSGALSSKITCNGVIAPTIIKVSATNHHQHELNDEGFEETQSLVSDTPSHGKEESRSNSSCNEATEQLQQKSQPLHKSTSSSGNSRSTSSNSKQTPNIASGRLSDRLQVTKLRTSKPAMLTQSLSRRTTSPANALPNPMLERARSLRLPNGHVVGNTHTSSAAAHMSNFTANASMRRAAATNSSLRRAAESMPSSPSHSVQVASSAVANRSSSSIQKRDGVERSSSRNSLRSSRSSINSGTSTQTVRRMPPLIANKAPPLHTASVDSSPSKRPLTMQNVPNTRHLSHPATAAHRIGVPASRSSSSGSSVGHNVIVVRKGSSGNRAAGNVSHVGSSSLGSTSFKENHVTPNTSRANAARSAVLVKAAMTHVKQNNGASSSANNATVQRSSSRIGSTSTRLSGFMRPTASSATKRNK